MLNRFGMIRSISRGILQMFFERFVAAVNTKREKSLEVSLKTVVVGTITSSSSKGDVVLATKNYRFHDGFHLPTNFSHLSLHPLI